MRATPMPPALIRRRLDGMAAGPLRFAIARSGSDPAGPFGVPPGMNHSRQESRLAVDRAGQRMRRQHRPKIFGTVLHGPDGPGAAGPEVLHGAG
jgi:hypothetical protein